MMSKKTNIYLNKIKYYVSFYPSTTITNKKLINYGKKYFK